MPSDWVIPSRASRQMPSSLRSLKRAIVRAIGPVIIVLSCVLSVFAVQYSVGGRPAQDFAVDPLRREVSWVLPGGGSWNAGIRRGQGLLELTHETTSDDWRLEATSSGGSSVSVRASSVLAVLRATGPVAILAALVSSVAVVLMAVNRSIAGALGILALSLVTVPVAATNEPLLSSSVLAGVPVAGSLWVWAHSGFPRERAAFAVVAMVVVGWITARAWLPSPFAALDVARMVVTVSIVVVALAVAAPWRRWVVRTATRDPPRIVDVAAITSIIAAAFGSLAIGHLPLWFVAVGAAALVMAYRVVRRPIGAALEELLLGGVRDRAAISATEEERARLAGEIHDGPLQAIAAAIAELHGQSANTEALELLRDAGAELRAVSAALRPSVLDDLGLGAAIAWLVEQARIRVEADLAITSDVDDVTGVARSARLPSDVELVAFRVVQEAVANAVRHSQASMIAIHGTISADVLSLAVVDDGRGMQEAEVRNARRAGRMGLATMRQRASSIGADLRVVPGAASGTVIRLDWRRS